MLKKDAATSWTEECQNAFDKIKEYLSKLPVLVPPEPGRPLLLYLSKAVKGQALADHLVENLMDGEYKSLKTYFPDEKVSFVGGDIIEAYDSWRMFFDGAENFKGVSIGAVLVSETGQHYPVAIAMNVQELLVIGDSNLLVHQALGEWATKNTKILPYLYCVQELIKRFMKIEFKHVSRIPNEFAYALATLFSMIQYPDKNFIDPIPIGIHKQPAYCAHVD
ncbi:uncharacterized protein [Nicotiana tomentosiformis]|uniref:uncharacterized protein n=1 Tax=Nicotiana tomentosiformis TaxID=4098 RepID=UPI00388CCA2B